MTDSKTTDLIDNEFRWETLLTQIKKSSILVERILSDTNNPMLNFKFEKLLVEFMKTLTSEEQNVSSLIRWFSPMLHTMELIRRN